MDNFIIAFVLVLVLVFVTRAIIERASKRLDQDKKAALIDLFSKSRVYTFGILIGIIVLFFISIRFNLIDPLITYILYIVAVLVFIIISSIHSYRILKRNNFPDFYIKAYILSSSLRFLGLVVFFAIIKF